MGTLNNRENSFFRFMATLQSPRTLTLVYLDIASVTIPEGLVKFINQAFGENFSIFLTIFKTTGIVLRALAKPPGLSFLVQIVPIEEVCLHLEVLPFGLQFLFSL